MTLEVWGSPQNPMISHPTPAWSPTCPHWLSSGGTCMLQWNRVHKAPLHVEFDLWKYTAGQVGGNSSIQPDWVVNLIIAAGPHGDCFFLYTSGGGTCRMRTYAKQDQNKQLPCASGAIIRYDTRTQQTKHNSTALRRIQTLDFGVHRACE